MWNTVAFPGLVLGMQLGFCMCVCLRAASQWQMYPHGEVSFQETKGDSITAPPRLNWPGDESTPVLDTNCCLATGRQDTGLYRILERLAGCFSFPYLHIFYHLLCKEGCKCKHRIRLCWDKMRAHHNLIQQRIHQHLQKTKQNKPTKPMSLVCYLKQAFALNFCLTVKRNYFK